MDGISVIICCYNSALKLPVTIQHLAKQKTNLPLQWEIIIVDNNSTDDTTPTALKCRNLFYEERKFSIIKERKAGLSNARVAGVKAALYDIIVFCDDDNFLADHYLQTAYNLVKKTKDSGFGIWGGNPVACFDADVIVPEWFEKEKANYVVGPQGKNSGDISDRGYVWGAGMIILKKLFLNIINDKFPLLLFDRIENILTSGGDSEISLRALILGFKLYFDRDLLLKHYISKNKLTPEYNAGLKKGFEQAHTVLNKYNIFIYYVSGRNFFSRNYYASIFFIKYILNTINLRKLTSLDRITLYALFNRWNFHDTDFDLMRALLKTQPKLN